MSTESSNAPKQNEEVDLMVFFNMIGRFFEKVYSFFVNVFKILAKWILELIYHFFKRKFWYLGAIILGFVAGYVIDHNSETQYGANLFIHTNFNSQRQVYENIKELRQLSLVDKDYDELAKRLGITVEEAASLRGFYIEPDIDDNTQLKLFIEYYKELDSASRENYSYNKYLDGLNAYSYSQHKIGVAAVDKHVFKKLKGKLIDELNNNAYLKSINQAEIANLKAKQIALEEEAKKTDSLIETALDIRLIEVNKEIPAYSGTILNMAGATESKNTLNEAQLLEKRYRLEDIKRETAKELVENTNLVNVLADFTETGYDISVWTDKMKLVLPIVLISLTFVIFLFLGVGKFVEEHKEKL